MSAALKDLAISKKTTKKVVDADNLAKPRISGGGGESSAEIKPLYWFVSDDIFYYKNLSDLKIKYNINCDFLTLPLSDDEVLEKVRNSEDFAVISTKKPNLKYRGIFIIVELPNKHGIRTTQQFLADVPESQALEERLGLSVIKSPFTLQNVGGAYALKTYTKDLLEAEKNGYKAKGIFLLGIPGTGKTFFPKCFAGETNRLLVVLNLTLIMESDEPIAKLNSIFEYLTERCKQFPEEKYVILIDEIEKMIGNAEPLEKRMLGRLLTVLNDINTEASEYAFNAIFFATANDLATILDNNPEFLRRGRWDELFFISLPTHEYAGEIFNLYIKKFKLQTIIGDDGLVPLKKLFTKIEKTYQGDNTLSDRFPYTAAEIENLCKRLDFIRKARGENFQLEDIDECIQMIIPLVKSAKKGIAKMAGQKELFIEI